jgi:recombination protein RecR
MSLIPAPLERLTEELARLPGIGPKTAQRLAFHCLRAPADQNRRLAAALTEVNLSIRDCSRCYFIADAELCGICRNSGRDQSVLCVVERPLDVLSIERSGEFRGLYHVLGGSLSPIDGVGPDQLRIAELLTRIDQGGVKEVILAMDPDVEGEATAHFLAGRLAAVGARVSRLAHGLPAGGDLQYADELTVARALSGRREVEGPV